MLTVNYLDYVFEISVAGIAMLLLIALATMRMCNLIFTIQKVKRIIEISRRSNAYTNHGEDSAYYVARTVIDYLESTNPLKENNLFTKGLYGVWYLLFGLVVLFYIGVLVIGYLTGFLDLYFYYTGQPFSYNIVQLFLLLNVMIIIDFILWVYLLVLKRKVKG